MKIKTILYVSTAILLGLFVISCSPLRHGHPLKVDTTKNNGYVLLYTDSLNMISLTHYKNNVKDGKEIFFFKSGEIASIGNYKKGLRHGWFYHYVLRDGEQYLARKIKYRKGVVIKSTIYNFSW